MADINNNAYVVEKFGRTKVMENDFWRSYTANLPTGIATLKPTGAATDTTNYIQHLNGIFVGETDGTVYLGHGLKGNVLNVFNGVNCGTLATGLCNYVGGSYESLKSVTVGTYNSTGAGYQNLTAVTTGTFNVVGSGHQNLSGLISGSFNAVGGGIQNIRAITNSTYNSVGAGYQNMLSVLNGSYNSIGAGYSNMGGASGGSYNSIGAGGLNLNSTTTTATYNAVGSGIENLFALTTGSYNSVGAGQRNMYYNNSGIYNSIGAGVSCLFYGKNGSFNSVGGGFECYMFSNHNHLTANGYKAGKNLIGNNNTSIGSLANFTGDLASVVSKTYTVATNNTITSTAHGFTVGSLITMPSGLGSIANSASPFYFKVLDANTLETYPNTLTNLTPAQTYTGTTSLATVKDYTNANAFGYNSQNTKSNQVALGDANVTELLLGGTLALDKVALVAAADGTPLVIRTVNGVKTITV